MTTDSWVPSGKNWMRATWVGDTQVIHVAFYSELTDDFTVVRKVSGSADPCGSPLGTRHELDDAKALAEHDEQELQEKGL